MEGVRRAEVIVSKRCSKLRVEFTPSLRSSRISEPFSPATTNNTSSRFQPPVRSDGPFSGLTICVTGLSKEARKQVKEATERLGGEYSPLLHSLCTHLVVQSYDGRKFEHALKHGRRESLHIVTLGWFVDSVRRNVKLSESFYAVKKPGDTKVNVDGSKSVYGVEKPHRGMQGTEFTGSKDLALSGYSVFIDPDISEEVSQVAVGGGAKLMNQWFIGCNASHVVCEAGSVLRYLGHSSNLVTPVWLQKTLEEKPMQNVVRMSADLARDLRTMLENLGKGSRMECVLEDASMLRNRTTTHKERQKIVESAKKAVTNRHAKAFHIFLYISSSEADLSLNRTLFSLFFKQMGKTLIQPNQSSLLDSICWTISEPTSTANVIIDSFSNNEDIERKSLSAFFDDKTNDSFTHSMRLLTESERMELENMSEEEIKAAIHTNSRQSEKLRAADSMMKGRKTVFKRIQFLGSRKGFEMLKRVSSFNCSNVYELIIKA
ncbi:BRCT domain [Arabidopsis suecica]|uniref:BRCT domain n=1 Tax=Arabidopsis suecica TaxID=45249 RepID=A0A8T1ZVS7_ARASU|nr:BRCT domain [Arabidopsis suecica]